MKRYLYLSLIPEALIASMLPPEEYGSYAAVGTKKRSRGQAIFFEVDRDQLPDYFPLGDIEEHCVPHGDGTPKRSLYLSIYRVLEHIPLDAFKDLYLATDDGRVLALQRAQFEPSEEEHLHLYQEFCPVTPRVVSNLSPREFVDFTTGGEQRIHVPRIVFCDLILRNLRRNPDAEDINDLPYKNIGHLRDCLRAISRGSGKKTKTVIRQMTSEVLFRTIKHGFFVGNKGEMIHYPMPRPDQLEREYYEWWRSALTTFGA